MRGLVVLAALVTVPAATIHAAGVRSSLRMSLDPKRTEWVGAGGNAYVIRFTKGDSSVNQDRGVVAKAFRDEDERDEAYEAMAEIPPLSVLAGLAYPRDGKDENTFSGKCVHVDSSQDCCGDWRKSDTCYFLSLDSAGTRTMEQCLEDQDISSKQIKYMVVSALEAVSKIHKAGWSHDDYQAKNIMLNDNCQSSSLRVVDLDGMSEERVGGVRMLRDVAMLLGLCDMGGLPLPNHLSRSCDRKAEEMANDILNLANDAMSGECMSLNRKMCTKNADDEECQAAYNKAKAIVKDLIADIKKLR